MEQIIEEIEKYVREGYSIKEIMNIMDKTIKGQYNGDYDKFFLLVKNVYEEPRNKWPLEAYEKLKEKRQQHTATIKQENIQKVANMVKTYTLEDADKYLSLKDALSKAVQKVAKETDLTATTVLKYVKLIYRDWYNECFNTTVAPEYLVATIENVIHNNMRLSEARLLPLYFRAVEYAKVNRPDLYAQLRENYDSHESYADSMVQKKKEFFKNTEILMNIVFEFRVPLNELYNFIKKAANVFCLEEISSQEELENILRANNTYHHFHAMGWYLYEATAPDTFTEYRINRFNNFQEAFFSLNTMEEQLRYAAIVSQVDLSSVNQKITNQRYSNYHYNFTLEDFRKIVRWCYNYALTTPEMEKQLGIPKINKKEIITVLESSDDIYDKMLVDGAKRLTEYHQDLAYSHGNRLY